MCQTGDRDEARVCGERRRAVVADEADLVAEWRRKLPGTSTDSNDTRPSAGPARPRTTRNSDVASCEAGGSRLTAAPEC